ncbi:response regulator [Minwuia thermotolerans]|uniref:Response regulator n=1 Tax=Minwuia thermotolerans TaxID=2056226 RepID=A0A2M9G6P2_9PROT|nr:response regulator [Minwuia thermotolerans]PJK31377.1 response regulator [Minwuia thermotolerans]
MADEGKRDTEAMLNGWRVLVVEDEALIALDLRNMLEGFGCTVVGPVATVENAVEATERDRPEAALLDEVLGEASVAPVAEELRRRGIPYAVVSGYSASPAGDPALREAPRLSKPVAVSDLWNLLAGLRRGATAA